MTKQITKHKSRRLRRFLKANEAVSALEYALVVGIIAVAVGAAMVVFSGSVEDAIKAIGDDVKTIKTDGAKTFKGEGG